MIKPLKPSHARLLAMLPKTFIVRVERVGEDVAGIDILDGTGGATKLDPAYPGFMSGLGHLLQVGLVFEAGVRVTGTRLAHRVDQTMCTVQVDKLTDR